MAKSQRGGSLKEEELMRFLRFSVTESAAATYTEQEYDTQLSVYVGYIWLVHFLQVDGIAGSNFDDPAQNAYEDLTMQITRESKTAMVNYNDADLIERIRVEHDRVATIGTDAGPWITRSIAPYCLKYPLPIPFASQNIYIGFQSTAAAAKTIRGRLGYTIKKVSDKEFFRIAQSLLT